MFRELLIGEFHAEDLPTFKVCQTCYETVTRDANASFISSKRFCCLFNVSRPTANRFSIGLSNSHRETTRLSVAAAPQKRSKTMYTDVIVYPPRRTIVILPRVLRFGVANKPRDTRPNRNFRRGNDFGTEKHLEITV